MRQQRDLGLQEGWHPLQLRNLKSMALGWGMHFSWPQEKSGLLAHFVINNEKRVTVRLGTYPHLKDPITSK